MANTDDTLGALSRILSLNLPPVSTSLPKSNLSSIFPLSPPKQSPRVPLRVTNGIPLPQIPLKKSLSLKDLFLENAKRIDGILDMSLVTTIARVVPKTDELNFNEGKLIETAVLFIDMRGSTALSQEKYKQTISKIYKAFFDCVGKVVSWKTGAHIRGFAGDRLMAVFTPGDNSCDIAVDTAIIMQTVVLKILNPKLKRKYGTTLDYGIGIDFGEMMATKVGIYGGGSNSDLVWSGNSANYASKLADFQGTSGIRITDTFFKKLTKHKTSESGGSLWKGKYSYKVGGKDIIYYKDEGIYKSTVEEIIV